MNEEKKIIEAKIGSNPEDCNDLKEGEVKVTYEDGSKEIFTFQDGFNYLSSYEIKGLTKKEVLELNKQKKMEDLEQLGEEYFGTRKTNSINRYDEKKYILNKIITNVYDLINIGCEEERSIKIMDIPGYFVKTCALFILALYVGTKGRWKFDTEEMIFSCIADIGEDVVRRVDLVNKSLDEELSMEDYEFERNLLFIKSLGLKSTGNIFLEINEINITKDQNVIKYLMENYFYYKENIDFRKDFNNVFNENVFFDGEYDMKYQRPFVNSNNSFFINLYAICQFTIERMEEGMI